MPYVVSMEHPEELATLHRDMMASGTIARPAILDSVRIVIRHAMKIWTGVEMAT
jgi:hypothetical protein